MQQNECRSGNRAESHDDTAGTEQAAKLSQWRTNGAIPPHRVIPVAPQSVPGERYHFGAVAGVLRVANIAVAASTFTRINIVREHGAGPLLRTHGRAADVAAIFSGMLGPAARARLVIVQPEVIQAEAVMTAGAAPRGLQAAFRAGWRRIDYRRRHTFSPFAYEQFSVEYSSDTRARSRRENETSVTRPDTA